MIKLTSFGWISRGTWKVVFIRGQERFPLTEQVDRFWNQCITLVSFTNKNSSVHFCNATREGYCTFEECCCGKGQSKVKPIKSLPVWGVKSCELSSSGEAWVITEAGSIEPAVQRRLCLCQRPDSRHRLDNRQWETILAQGVITSWLKLKTIETFK